MTKTYIEEHKECLVNLINEYTKRCNRQFINYGSDYLNGCADGYSQAMIDVIKDLKQLLR